MTPSARYAAAIDILDDVLGGVPVEKTLTTWARNHRFAGSGDRAAIRDLVFDIVRKKRSCAAMGGSATGRGLVLGKLRLAGVEPTDVFTGEKFAPAVLSRGETAQTISCADLPEPVRFDYQDWIEQALKSSLGDDFQPVLALLRDRAGIFLRINPRRADIDTAIAALADDGITAISHPLTPLALEVIQNPRRVAGSRAFQGGMVELQDVASQAVINLIALPNSGSILDYCAGGGGKALAMAAQSNAQVFAYDALAQRMVDIPSRAKRAGVNLIRLSGAQVARKAPFDLVLCDVPCSGSGAWRRAPAGKWDLTPQRLAELQALQAEILTEASQFVAPGGSLAYVTCSVLRGENQDQVSRFLTASSGFGCVFQQVYTPLDGGDGMFVAVFRRI